MKNRCKLNSCCGDQINCNPPEQFKHHASSAALPEDTREIVERYVAQCRAISEDGKFSWWADLADLITHLTAELARVTAERDEVQRQTMLGTYTLRQMARAEKAEAARYAAEADREELMKAVEPFAVLGEELTDENGWTDAVELTVEADPHFGHFATLKAGAFRRASSTLSRIKGAAA